MGEDPGGIGALTPGAVNAAGLTKMQFAFRYVVITIALWLPSVIRSSAREFILCAGLFRY